jgi:hypothetical protein
MTASVLLNDTITKILLKTLKKIGKKKNLSEKNRKKSTKKIENSAKICQ